MKLENKKLQINILLKGWPDIFAHTQFLTNRNLYHFLPHAL